MSHTAWLQIRRDFPHSLRKSTLFREVIYVPLSKFLRLTAIEKLECLIYNKVCAAMCRIKEETG
jgi:hypothetical protein